MNSFALFQGAVFRKTEDKPSWLTFLPVAGIMHAIGGIRANGKNSMEASHFLVFHF